MAAGLWVVSTRGGASMMLDKFVAPGSVISGDDAEENRRAVKTVRGATRSRRSPSMRRRGAVALLILILTLALVPVIGAGATAPPTPTIRHQARAATPPRA